MNVISNTHNTFTFKKITLSLMLIITTNASRQKVLTFHLAVVFSLKPQKNLFRKPNFGKIGAFEK